jgi:hypothetical protein
MLTEELVVKGCGDGAEVGLCAIKLEVQLPAIDERLVIQVLIVVGEGRRVR